MASVFNDDKGETIAKVPTSADPISEQKREHRASRRWLLGLEPFFEGGWLHKGTRAQAWDVEERVVAVALLGDVTVDLSKTKTAPTEVHVDAYAIGRDVDVVVPEGARVEVSSRPDNDHVSNRVTFEVGESSQLLVRVTGHTFLGDVNISTARGGA